MFGGFTPTEWEPREWNREYGDENNCWKGDDSGRSFLFTLRNPHGVPPRRLALKKEKKERAIYCCARKSAGFAWDILVCDSCHTNGRSYTRIGTNYKNNEYANNVDFEHFFTGAINFTVKEIEVFEIAN
jgi:hypothetical protein